ncbi:MAG: cell envelope integrity protein TolA [Steroidobacteraceae bacterium]
MPGFVREHLRPLMGAAGLHLVLLVLLAGAALRWTAGQPPVQLAIEGVVVDARDLPRSVLAGKPLPEPPPPPVEKVEPAPLPEPARPDPKAAEEARAAERAAAEARAADEAARRQAVADAERKRLSAEAEADAKAKAEAVRKREEQEKAAREAKMQSEREAELQRQLAAEEEAAAVARSGVVDEYRALLIQAIERNWIRPPSARAGLECTLFVNQAAGGTVIDVKLGTCNGDQAVRESITNAVYRASPLPAPRDPRAFERRLQIVFKPTE